MAVGSKLINAFRVISLRNSVNARGPLIKKLDHTKSFPFQGCKRESEYPIPKSKIDGVYDMTFVNLNVLAQKDKEKC